MSGHECLAEGVGTADKVKADIMVMANQRTQYAEPGCLRILECGPKIDVLGGDMDGDALKLAARMGQEQHQGDQRLLKGGHQRWRRRGRACYAYRELEVDLLEVLQSQRPRERRCGRGAGGLQKGQGVAVVENITEAQATVLSMIAEVDEKIAFGVEDACGFGVDLRAWISRCASPLLALRPREWSTCLHDRRMATWRRWLGNPSSSV